MAIVLGAETTKNRTEIPALVESLNHATENISNSFERIRSLTESVVSKPTPKGSEKSAVREEPKTNLGNELDHILTRLYTLREIIDDVADRMEL